MTDAASRRMSATPVPLWIKLAYLAFLGVLVPVYWRAYGPQNFLWFSDVALFSIAAAVVVERPAWLRPALVGMVAVGVLPLEIMWCVDFVTGAQFTGLTAYMFDERATYLKALSLFHLALPPTTIWLLWRHGYDRRSLVRQTVLVWIVLPLTYLIADPALNINWAFGPGNEPQRTIPPLLYLALEMVAIPAFVLFPTDWILRRLFRPAYTGGPSRPGELQ
ncbi:MAG: membrane-associated protein [Gemmatimonas sp.]